MGTAEDVNRVKKNILTAYERKRVLLFALSLDYAGRVINDFRQLQENAEFFWENQTDQALKTMFTKAYQDDDEIGFFMSHMKIYGIYLELANDRQNEAIRPMIAKWAPRFFKAARAIV